MTLKEYTNQFQCLATRVSFRWDDEILVALYRHEVYPQISTSLCLNHYWVLDDVI